MKNSKNRFKRFILINGNRHVVAGLLVLTAFMVLVTLGFTGTIRLDQQEAVRGIAGGFIPGLIAFLTIVLAINQLVLSQEFGSAGEVRDQIQQVREYRQDVEDIADTGPSPILPTNFLSFVVQAIVVEATMLEESVGPDTDPSVRETVEKYATTVTEEAGDAQKSLERVQPGRINALLPVLEYDDSRQLLEARRLQFDLGDALPTQTQQTLSRLTETLELFSVARMQFRTTYTQRVLARLSRQLLYVGLPALLVVIVLGLLEPSFLTSLSDNGRIVLMSLLLSVALLPLAVLSAFLIRVSIISERTIAAGPFVSRPKAVQTDRASDSKDESSIRTDTTNTLDNGGK